LKVAIQHIKKSFSERWITYCEENNIDFELIDLFDNQIINTLKKGAFTHLMCQVPNEDSRLFFSLQGIYQAAEQMGIQTFPSIGERWHFDNKVYQKYLFESIDASFAKTDVFFNESEAIEYIEKSNYPIVAKLKRGAGSVNVQLLNTIEEAKSYIHTMFTTGINPTPKALDNLKDKMNYAKKFKNPIELIQKGIRYTRRIKSERNVVENEKGYVLFQEFLPNNNFDTRIVVANDIAFGLIRLNRENDFRASGSGQIDYDHTKIDPQMVKIAFELSEKLGFSLMGYDFLIDENNKPKLVELCYAFTANSYDKCEGYWDKELKFHEGSFTPHMRMMKNFLKQSEES